MKVDPYYVWLLKGFAMATVAVLLAVLVFYMWVAVGVLEDRPDGYYTEHYHSGTIIGMNESRLVFYVETSKSISEVPVGPSDFNRYEIGDFYEWWTQTYHRYGGLTNMTMIHSW